MELTLSTGDYHSLPTFLVVAGEFYAQGRERTGNSEKMSVVLCPEQLHEYLEQEGFQTNPNIKPWPLGQCTSTMYVTTYYERLRGDSILEYLLIADMSQLYNQREVKYEERI
jgi:hypothetical protein